MRSRSRVYTSIQAKQISEYVLPDRWRVSGQSLVAWSFIFQSQHFCLQRWWFQQLWGLAQWGQWAASPWGHISSRSGPLWTWQSSSTSFHSVFPYRGRLCMQWDTPGSPPSTTSPLVSLPLHTGCLKSGWSPQTAAYQALSPVQRGTWSGTCRWSLSRSPSGRTPWRRQLAAGGPVSCGSDRVNQKWIWLFWGILFVR